MDSMLFTGFCPEQAARGEGAWTQRPEPSLKALLLGQKRNGCECLGGEGEQWWLPWPDGPLKEAERKGVMATQGLW